MTIKAIDDSTLVMISSLSQYGNQCQHQTAGHH